MFLSSLRIHASAAICKMWIVGAVIVVNTNFVSAEEPLRYKIKPQQVVPYRVKIEAETPRSFHTMNGTITFTGKVVENETINLFYSGGLTKTEKTKSTEDNPTGLELIPPSFGRGFPLRIGPPDPWVFGPFGPSVLGRRGFSSLPRSALEEPEFRGLTYTTSEFVITNQGGVRSMRGETQLPFLLGNLSLFPFDALPDGDQDQWQEGNGLTITTKSKNDSRYDSRFGPFGDQNNDQVKFAGSESVSYKIQKRDGDLCTISKTYSLDSPATTKEDKSFKGSGTGTWVFNQTDGVSESMDFTSQLVVSANNSDVRIPIKIEWKRIPAAEYEAMTKEQQEKAAAAAKELHEKMAESSKELQERMAASSKEFYERLEREAKEAKEKEGKALSAAERKEILADLDAEDWPTISHRLVKLSSFVPHPNDFDIAKRIKGLRSHSSIGVSLRAKQLWDRLEPILDAAAEKGNEELETEEMTGDEENPFVTEEEKIQNANRGIRVWADRTGSHKVEAQFVRVDGANAILKRKDGKEIKVPIARLSSDDQKIIKELSK